MGDGKGRGAVVGDHVGTGPSLTEEQDVHMHEAAGRGGAGGDAH